MSILKILAGRSGIFRNNSGFVNGCLSITLDHHYGFKAELMVAMHATEVANRLER